MEWTDLKRLFHSACDCPPEERDAFLLRECPDPEQRAKLLELLEQDSSSTDFLEHLVHNHLLQLQDRTAPDRAGQQLGAYCIDRLLGSGGMGEVYLARRSDQNYDNLVAIKIVRPGLEAPQLQRRFRQERQILARLKHPNIAHLLDGGSTPDGLPYLVMEYVEGIPITEYCERHGLDIAARCRLLLQVCDAVAHAHRNLVIHRDLKPSNILVARGPASNSGEGPQVKLLDFGIAKLLHRERSEDDPGTTLFHRPLTPDYASPEQVTGAAITTAADVYMSGGVLFHLLTGHKPHTLSSHSPEEVERIICRTPIPRPSQVKPEWRRELRGDLDNIVLRALRAVPEERYSSIELLAEDLRRYLDGRPVSARPDTLGYRLGKWLLRYRLTAAALALVVVATVAGLAATLHQARRAERRFNQVRNLAKVVVFDLHDEIATLPGATSARKKIVATALEYLENLSGEASGDAELAIELAGAYIRLGDVQGSPQRSNLGDAAGALTSYRRAEQLLLNTEVRRHPLFHIRTMNLYMKLSQLQRAQGDAKASVESLRLARRSASDLLARSPGDQEALEGSTASDQMLSRTLNTLGDLKGSVEAARAAVPTAEKLATSNPGDSKLSYVLATAYSNLGLVLVQTGDIEGAAAAHRSSIAIRENIARDAPANSEFQRALMIGYGHLGDILGFQFGIHVDDLDGARQVFEKAAAIAESLVRQDASDERARFDLISANLRLGTVLISLRETTASHQLLQRALSLNSALLEKNPSRVQYRETLVYLKQRLGMTLAQQGRFPEAIDNLRFAVAEADKVLKGPRSAANRLNAFLCRLRLAMVQAKIRPVEETRLMLDTLEAELARDRDLARGWGRARLYHDLGLVHLDLHRRSAGAIHHAKARSALESSRQEWSRISGGALLLSLRQRELDRLQGDLALLPSRH